MSKPKESFEEIVDGIFDVIISEFGVSRDSFDHTRAYILAAHLADKEAAVRAANIRQIKNLRDYIKHSDDVGWLVRDMNTAIKSLEDEKLTDENGIWREALQALDAKPVSGERTGEDRT